LTFFRPDLERFPALRLAYRALDDGESMPAVMNAANEVAVEMFLAGRIGFTEIPVLIEKIMDEHQPVRLNSIADVLDVDLWSRAKIREFLEK
jgi:1-deoxy-D-xylulose-5-phosphate reductoisomerase